ncbi:MAG: nickel-dependent hydrogenase large subunit, partial [Actinobacteria bacterium]|nr:nickel-dependent hydrogenase large subunit [Actinomycetota bacterium]
SGSIIADQLDPQKYYEYIGESVQASSYLKSPYYSPLGFPDGMYRVGPLARLNVAEQMGTPKADAELKKFKKLTRGRNAVTSSFHYHYARLIEILTSIERVEAYLDDPDMLSEDLRADAGINSLRGVGVSEAPRGTLFHDYTVDRDGLRKKVNLIVATGQNNLAMNQIQI